jgi:hypothetical protein
MSNRRIARSTVYYLDADRKETCQSRLRSIAIHYLPWQAAPARQRAKWCDLKPLYPSYSLSQFGYNIATITNPPHLPYPGLLCRRSTYRNALEKLDIVINPLTSIICCW